MAPSPSESLHTSSFPISLGGSVTVLRLFFLQHNCLGSRNVFLSLFSSISEIRNPFLIVALQDVPLWQNLPPTIKGFKCFHPPFSPDYKICVSFYISVPLVEIMSILPLFFNRGDLVGLNLFSQEGIMSSLDSQLRILNAYNNEGTLSHNRTITPDLLFPELRYPCLTLGDLNIHHNASDPGRLLMTNEELISSPYFSLADKRDYHLLNDPGAYTFFPFNLSHRCCVIDVTFANNFFLPMFDYWDNTLPHTGSDHIPILLHFNIPALRAAASSPNWALTDWTQCESTLKSLVLC